MCTNDKFEFWSYSRFTTLRNLAITRITLYNARHGGEPARLTLAEWQDGYNNVWDNPVEKDLVRGGDKICYQAGKGNRLVDVIIPEDTVKTCQLLADGELRIHAGVKKDNKFLFACTISSEDHATGPQAVQQVRLAAGISTNLTATKMRHRASTVHASLERTAHEKDLFFNHMGHSKDINENIYQCHLAKATKNVVGDFLRQLDERNLSPQQQSEGLHGSTSPPAAVCIPTTSQCIAPATKQTAMNFNVSRRMATRAGLSVNLQKIPSTSNDSSDEAALTPVATSDEEYDEGKNKYVHIHIIYIHIYMYIHI